MQPTIKGIESNLNKLYWTDNKEYMLPVRMRRDHGTVSFERMMKIAKKYIFDSDTILYQDNEVLELIMRVAFISQEPDCIVEYYID